NRFRLPEDGAIWVDRQVDAAHNSVEALYVRPGSGADNAGIHPGDRLERIDGVPVDKSATVAQILVRLGSWSKAKYLVSHSGVPVEATVIIGEAPRALAYEYLVGLAYLVIGLFVYFRRGSAHKARHFYILCLSSFIFFCFHYTGQLNSFDKVIYYGNVAAGLLAPTVFLHFCLTFPEPRKWFLGKTRKALLYVPAAVLFAAYVAFSSDTVKIGVPLLELSWMLDRFWV